jgi:hypothetical protein
MALVSFREQQTGQGAASMQTPGRTFQLPLTAVQMAC